MPPSATRCVFWLFVAVLTASCNDEDTNLTCPGHPEMVLLPGRSVCMDRYEASMWSSANCTGTQYGVGLEYDYPPGFPYHVESKGCTGDCAEYLGEPFTPGTLPQQTPVYACSLAAVMPSTQMTHLQAKRACENSGKRLCLIEEWTAACTADGKRAYPYSSDNSDDGFDPDACNGCPEGASDCSKKPTGSLATCEGGYDGLFDLTGNLYELVGPCANGQCPILGGGYGERPEELRCDAKVISLPGYAGEVEMGGNGTRCCLDNEEAP